MGLVKTRRLAAMQKHPPALNLRRTWQRAIHLRQGYGGLKAGMTLRVALAPTNGWPLMETQAHLHHIVCLPSSDPSSGYWKYNVETSGTLIDCLAAGVDRGI